MLTLAGVTVTIADDDDGHEIIEVIVVAREIVGSIPTVALESDGDEMLVQATFNKVDGDYWTLLEGGNNDLKSGHIVAHYTACSACSLQQIRLDLSRLEKFGIPSSNK